MVQPDSKFEIEVTSSTADFAIRVLDDEAFVGWSRGEEVDCVNSHCRARWTHKSRQELTVKEFGKYHVVLTNLDLANAGSFKVHIFVSSPVPESFDLRTTACPGVVLDQGRCGSCWAFASSSTFTQRLCMAGEVDASTTITPQTLVSCDSGDDGCGGGWSYNAWRYFSWAGAPTCSDLCHKGCVPYESGTCTTEDRNGCVTCMSTCTNTTAKQDLHYSNIGRWVTTSDMPTWLQVLAIQTELFYYGSVEVAWDVYDNFGPFFKANPLGLYDRKGSDVKGSHATRVAGWGRVNDTDYWLIANSWGQDWGERGYFKFLRGKNLAGVEGSAYTGYTRAQLDSIRLPRADQLVQQQHRKTCGWTHVSLDKNDDTVSRVVELATSRVLETNDLSSSRLRLASVESQVVAGVNYRVTFEVSSEDSVVVHVHETLKDAQLSIAAVKKKSKRVHA